MDVVVTILAFIGILFVLVLVHELGHFIVAKRAGITVQEFGIGFPPRIASVMRGGTRYSLNWIPLGGFVKMLGEDGDAEVERMRDEGRTEAEVESAMAGAFNRKPIWVRLVVLVAGVVMNFVLAIVLLSIVFGTFPNVVGGRGPLRITSIQEGSPAAEVGLQAGDVIVTADGQSFERSEDLRNYILANAGEEVALEVERGDEVIDLTVVPRRPEEIRDDQGAIGFTWTPADGFIEEPPLAPLDALGRGVTETFEYAAKIPGGVLLGVGGLLGLVEDPPDVAGPIGIARETGEVLQLPLASQLAWVALLSTNLAVLNILPFPPLDGGRILVVLIEFVRRRRLNPRREALIYATGMVVLLGLIILVSINDIGRQ